MPFKTGIRLLGVARNPANGFPARLLGLLFVGCAASENSGGGESETPCLGEEDFQRIRGERNADPAAAEVKYLGQRFCLVGEALNVRYLSNSIYVSLLFARDV